MTVKTIRTDTETDAAVKFLSVELGDDSFSSIVRYSLLETARRLRRTALRAEAEALRNDPDDVAEMRAIREDMEDLDAW